MELQERMNDAFDNYLSVSNILVDDGMLLLDLKDDDVKWRRHFIRSTAAMIEGYSHCFRQISAIGLECDSINLTKAEREVLLNEGKFNATDRIKLTLRVSYKMFGYSPIPNFESDDWQNAIYALDRRHMLMHPKTVDDLEISSESWDRIHSGLEWLITQHFKFIQLIYENHGKKD